VEAAEHRLHFSATLKREEFFAELHQLVLSAVGGSLPGGPAAPGLPISTDSPPVADLSFAVLLAHADEAEVECGYSAQQDGKLWQQRVPEAEMPDWWRTTRAGKLVSLSSSDQARDGAPVLPTGWQVSAPVEALLVVPLLTQTTEQCLGALVLLSMAPRLYRREQVELLTTLAHTAAASLEKAELHHRSTRSEGQALSRKMKMAALNNAVLTLNSSLQLKETLDNLVKQCSLLTAAQVCSVFLLDEDGKTLVVRASNADLHALRVERLEAICFVPSKAFMKKLKAGEQLFLDHLEVERQSQTPAGELYRRLDIHSVLLLPITRHERLLGMLAVYTPGQRMVFPPEEVTLLEGLASQAAIAIHNAGLFMDLQRALEQQKELDRLKDEFIVTASHEFRTPLSAIHGYASLLQRHSTRLTTEQAQRFSTEITRAAQQLVGMVQTLMDASRLDSGKLTLSLQAVEVRPLAESALALIQPDIAQPIHLDIAPGRWVSADQQRLRQVMTNLLTNAGKYSPASSPIEFVAQVQRTLPPAALLTAAPDQEYLVMSVVDHGEGISEEEQTHLFQKFVRLQKSLTTPVRGTGLGLYICRQYLTAMGGAIWVESTPGHGASFRVALPVVAPPPEKPGASRRPGHLSQE
jgi:signal transduction histidine kinase